MDEKMADGGAVYVVLTPSGAGHYTRDIAQAERIALERHGEIQKFSSLDAALRVCGALKPIQPPKTDET